MQDFPACTLVLAVELGGMKELHCPNCGALVSPAVASVKMITCTSCSTTLLLQDGGLRLAGRQGVLHDGPMLFGLGDTATIAGIDYHILGQARFSYERGSWDEFWATDTVGAAFWISVDEGDLILQRSLSRQDWPKYDGYLSLGSTLRHRDEEFTVAEQGDGTCTGLRGSFGHALSVGESYRFLNLQGEDGSVLSAEIEARQYEWFLGQWIDPFDVTVRRS
ncbi:hypothetical protein PH5382_02842 [Phaeobacter sp. CECT 5382]|uniref:DUF4178 domain-containing protein n=1 Tax=Phaeobacter sp. CECT 5382 TaxID=1712645 RepID=UPI0006DA72DA|nr:DUF4178 domain-containing protein [Phaeobacter sp. CECT 5382]CUH88898.1 hypothetical protein PH5382_02842 [Phaeobacter sp. CECT 5382]